MTFTPIECEARLVGLSKQRRKDGDWIEVKFHIHPDDHPAALFILPLGTNCMLSIKGVPEKEDEATTEAPAEAERPKGGERAKRAGILCNDKAFQVYAVNAPWAIRHLQRHADLVHMSDPGRTAELLRLECRIMSRAELDHDVVGAEIFDALVSDFYNAQQGRTDAALMEQRR